MKNISFYVLAISLSIVTFVAALKMYDVYLTKTRPGVISVDASLDRPTMRTMKLYPYTALHVQPNFHSKGRLPWDGYKQVYDVRSGDHGFFVDFDIDEPPTKKNGEYRIILTGGSGAQGWGGTTNEKMFYRLLESGLNRALARASSAKFVKVINLAMASTISYQNYIALNIWGHGLEPDMIVSFSGHNEIAVPNDTRSDANYPGSALAGIAMVQQYYLSPGWMKAVAKVLPGLIFHTDLGIMLRTLYRKDYADRAQTEYWLSRYDSDYRGQIGVVAAQQRYKKLEAGFDLQNKVMTPWYIHAIDSIRRDFPKIPLVLALQPLHETAKDYNDLRNDMKAVFDGRTAEKTYWIDVHKHWEENEYFQGSLVDSVHLKDMGHARVAEFLTRRLLPIILANAAPR